MTSRLFLVGFMGAGKTTVGRLLAERLNWSFVDLDAEIERAEGQSVSEIFASRGEDWFRAAEAGQLRTVSAPRSRVVSLGGGTYADAENRALVDALGLSVFLDAPLDVLIRRIGDDGARPLARSRSRLERLFRDRIGSYRQARLTVETTNRTPADVVDEILRVLGDL